MIKKININIDELENHDEKKEIIKSKELISEIQENIDEENYKKFDIEVKTYRLYKSGSIENYNEENN